MDPDSIFMKYSFLASVLGGLMMLIFNKRIWELQQEKKYRRHTGYLPIESGEWVFRVIVVACGIISILFGAKQVIP